MEAEAAAPVRVRVWDLPVRVVHWLIAALVLFSWWSANNDHLPWHRLSGYTLLGLLVFRLIWGVVGSPTARFSRFLRGPAAIVAYLRGAADRTLGHNPLGGWSIVALLGTLAAQISLGLFAIDEDSLEPGPLNRFISFDTGRAIARLHHKLFWVLLALIVLHLLAIAFYAARRRNLVGPMITGVTEAPAGVTVPPLAPAWRILPAAAVAIAFAWWIAHGLRL